MRASLLAVLVLIACGDDDAASNAESGRAVIRQPERAERTQQQGMAVTKQVALPEGPEEEERSEAEPVPGAAGEIVIEVRNHHMDERETGELRLSLTERGGELIAYVMNLRTYCAPTPTFRGTREGDVLKVGLLRPDGAVSRCVGSHRLALAVTPSEGIRSVELAGIDGEMLGRAERVSAATR